MRLGLIILIGVLVILVSSGFIYLKIQEPDYSYDPIKCSQKISDCPTLLSVDNRKLKIDYFFIWRNDMPFYPTNSQRMIFVVELKFTDDLEFDSNVKPIGFKLVNENDDAWEGKFEEINRPNCGLNCLEKYASGGPNWNGGIEVIPSIILDYNGNQYVIRGPPATVLITV